MNEQHLSKYAAKKKRQAEMAEMAEKAEKAKRREEEEAKRIAKYNRKRAAARVERRGNIGALTNPELVVVANQIANKWEKKYPKGAEVIRELVRRHAIAIGFGNEMTEMLANMAKEAETKTEVNND